MSEETEVSLYQPGSLVKHDHDHDRWDEQLDADSAAGKLDFLFGEPIDPNSPLREWPPK
jgi:hypothetical protein